MPYPNEHACRLNDPGKYLKMRRENNAAKVDGKFVDHIYGILATNKSELQAVRYPLKNGWDKAEAAARKD